MTRGLAHVLRWSIGVALLTALAAALYQGYAIHQAGEPLDAVSPLVMAFETMRLHDFALYGAVGGLGIGSVRWVMSLVGGSPIGAAREPGRGQHVIEAVRAGREPSHGLRRHAQEAPERQEERTPGRNPPLLLENTITAGGGKFTYHVLAYLVLQEQELKDLIAQALEQGVISEPEEGGSTMLVTTIGKEFDPS